MFKKVNPRQNFPEMEKEVMKYWKEEKIFEKSVENRGDEKNYSFFDGPPFATGLPHYGHVVASLIKDVVPRFWTMKGNKVNRKWGWDCHGLPIENLIEKEHDIKNKQDIEKWGVDNFNDACHKSVLRYSDDWKKFIPRMGRWVDMENDYRTMDWKYTESIWWVFSELFKKGLVYEGHKAMHICPRCETTLSNFEVTQGYKNITDLSATVKFRLKKESVEVLKQKILNQVQDDNADSHSECSDSEMKNPDTMQEMTGSFAKAQDDKFTQNDNVFVLAWTTTPWTLPGNVALAVGNSIKYLVLSIKGENNFYILAKDRIAEILKDKEFEILNEIDGSELVGLEYEPLFDYYSKKNDLENRENGWKIYAGDFVSTEEGTGVVHIAPAFGDDDMKLGQKYNLPFVKHIKMNGRFTEEVVDFKNKDGENREVKPKRNPRETDEKIVKWLEENSKLFTKDNYKHSYPHCWRCETPLLNYATSSWFVKVTEIKDEMVKNNKQINWTPEYIKNGRFGKWLEDARDWAVSRNRFWGAPLPIWKCSDCENIEVMKSIDDLREKTDEKITKFILLRHGESESNVKDIMAGQLDGYLLTEKGIKQSKNVAEILKNEKIDIIISSPIQRTKQTADIINDVLGIERVEDDRIREYDFGAWNGHNSEELFCDKNELFQEYKKLDKGEDQYNFKFGGDGESRSDVEDRVKEFAEDINKKYAGKTVLIVTHGGVNAMFEKLLNKVSKKDIFSLERILKNIGRNIFYLNEKSEQFNLHKPNIDGVKIKCSKCQSEVKILGDVFDCWFESGSMPYAQYHYPFETQAEFEKSFPADFIAEGLDQTRGWFYTLMVLSTALFDKAPFKNVIVNGMVLAEDGQKMSKRLKNYPEPNLVIEKYGADALRYYLLSSSVMKGESLRFSEKGVNEVLKKFILTLWNTYSFFVMNVEFNEGMKGVLRQAQDDNEIQDDNVVQEDDDAQDDNEIQDDNTFGKSNNLLDKWIISELNILIGEVNSKMENYDLVRASRPLREFIDKLSNWYVRRSRKRFMSEDVDDRNLAHQTLYYVLMEYTKLLAPFMPFLSEEIYKNLTDKKSVHFADYPVARESLINEKVSGEMNFIRQIITLGLAIRAKNGIKVRQPLSKLKVESEKMKVDDNNLISLIKDELNVKEVEFVDEIKEESGFILEEDEKLRISLDLNITEELRNEGFAREIVRHIQVMRKEAKYNRNDMIIVEYNYSENGEGIKKVFKKWGDYLKKECLAGNIDFSNKFIEVDFDLIKELKAGSKTLKVGIKKV